MNSAIVALDARLVSGQSTGDSTYWTGLLYGLSRINPDVTILLLSNKPRPSSVPDSPQFRWVTLPARNSRWWSLVKFPLEARRLNAGCIHAQYSLSPLVQNRGVTTIHDVSFFIGPEWFKPKDRLLLQRSIPSTIRRAAAVITVSDTSRREIERFIPAAERKTFVTPNACPPWVSPLPKDEAQQVVSRELGIEGPFLFTLGTRWPRKNMQLAIDAVEGLSADLDHKLIVTGKSGWGEQTAGKRTHFSGYLEDRLISALYSAATLYLAPSRHEGFGIPVLEAYRCGCPVLASTGGALPEVVGEAGEIEPSWDSADWTSHIESLLRDPSKLATMSESGRVRERLFTWEDTARATLSVYRKVLR